MSGNTVSNRAAGKATLAIILGVLAIGLIGGGTAWWLQRGEDRPPAGPAEAIVLAASLAYPGSALISIAEAKGHFAAEGLQVTLKAYPTGKACLDAALAGEADFTTTADIPVMFASMKDAPVAILASMSTTSGGDYGIVARRDRGIGSPEALKGKRVGVPAGTSAHFFVDGLMLRRRVDASQFKVVNVAPAKMPEALAAGEVDAIGVWEPYLGQVKEALGDKAITFGQPGIYDSPWLLAAHRELAARRPEAARRLLRALIRAERYFAAEPAAAREALAKARNEDLARVEKLISVFRFDVRLAQSLLGGLEDEARWAIRTKIVDRTTVPNYLDYLYLDGLRAVRPERVSVIH